MELMFFNIITYQFINALKLNDQKNKFQIFQIPLRHINVT